MSSDSHKTSFLSRIKAALWPVYNSELKMFLPMALIIFGILYNYTILRNMKDTLVVNSAGAGALTFLKLYFVTPAALFFVVLYTKVSNSFGREKSFYIIISSFLLFFLAFAFFIYPNKELLHPSGASVALFAAKYPRMEILISIYANWSYALFFILAEIWGSLGISLLFWQFANQIVKIEQSKRFYPLFIALGNVSLILCGVIVSKITSVLSNLPFNENEKWLFSMKIQLFSVFVVGVISMLAYKFVNKYIVPTLQKEEKKSDKKKEKPGLLDSFKFLIRYRHLQLIAALVICYGITINLVEVQWKNQIKIHFAGDRANFNSFMNNYSMWTGVASILFGWIAGSGILRKLKWFSAAVITPITIACGGVIIFLCISLSGVIKSLALNPVAVAVFTGAVVVIISKVIKYSLFDSTKEMSYIPLEDDVKAKGKAAVEVLGGRLGKAGGALIQSTSLMILGTANIVAIVPISFTLFIVFCIVWIYAVKALSKKMPN